MEVESDDDWPVKNKFSVANNRPGGYILIS